MEREKEKEKVLKLLEENSELQRTVQENLAAAEKWKGVYDAMYSQFERANERLGRLEEENDRMASQFKEQMFAKDQVVSDLSEQLKESEERIHDLLVESEGTRRVSKEREKEHEENISRIIMAMDSKYKVRMC